jgi:hypothetical protein
VVAPAPGVVRVETAAGYVLSLASQPVRKRNQGLDAIKKHISALCPEDMPVFTNASHNISSLDRKCTEETSITGHIRHTVPSSFHGMSGMPCSPSSTQQAHTHPYVQSIILWQRCRSRML